MWVRLRLRVRVRMRVIGGPPVHNDAYACAYTRPSYPFLFPITSYTHRLPLTFTSYLVRRTSYLVHMPATRTACTEPSSMKSRLISRARSNRAGPAWMSRSEVNGTC